jgi:protein gp37
MRVFCASMADVFEDNRSVESERMKLWSLIAETPMLDWLLLTKRPENMVRFAPWKDPWPANVWAMTSVENQEQAVKRIPALTYVPAVVRGLSVEPLIGCVDLNPWLDKVHWVIVGGESGREARPMNPAWVLHVRDQCIKANVPFFFKQWGEWAPSSPDAHVYYEMNDTSWRNKIQRFGKKAAGRLLDGRTWDALPVVAMAK